MGAKLTRLADTVSKSRRRSSSSPPGEGCSSANGADPSSAGASATAVDRNSSGACGPGVSDGGGVYLGQDDAREQPNGETGHDPAVHGAKLEDRNYNNESFKKRTVDPSDPQQQNAAVTIQSQFRQHSAKAEVKAMHEEDAATRIQAGFRGFIDREQVRTMKGDEPTQPTETSEPAAGQEEEEEVDIDLTDPDVEKAAIKIQAGFKGFKARKEVYSAGSREEAEKEQSAPAEQTEVPPTQEEPEAPQVSEQPSEQPPAEGEEEIDIDLNDPDVEKAAVKIQAGFKGLKARKSLKQKTDDSSGDKTEPAAAEDQQESTEKKEEEEVDIDLNDPETEKAALKIQAGFRGYQTRRDIGGEPSENTEKTEEAPAVTEEAPAAPEEAPAAPEEAPAASEEATAAEEAQAAPEEAPAAPEESPAAPEEAPAADVETKPAEEEEVDIDLNDPEVEKAAVKIQSGFKGFKARKEMESKKDAVDGGAPQQDAAKAEESVAGASAEEGEETAPKEPEGGD